MELREYSSQQTNPLDYPDQTSSIINSSLTSTPHSAQHLISSSTTTMSTVQQSNLSDYVTINYNGIIGINASDPFKITAESRMFSLPLGIQILMCLMYGTLAFTAVASNMIVCYIVLSSQKMRTATNYFIVNLAVGDILMALLCIPFTFPANLIYEYWPFGLSLCIIVSYSQANSVFISAYTMVAISIDKYIAIMYPMRLRMPKNQAKIIILVIWSLALLTSLPTAILSRLVPAWPDSVSTPTPPAPTTPTLNIPTSLIQPPSLRPTTTASSNTVFTTPASLAATISVPPSLFSPRADEESALLKKESSLSNELMAANEVSNRPNPINRDITQLEQLGRPMSPGTVDGTPPGLTTTATMGNEMTATNTTATVSPSSPPPRTAPTSQMKEKEQQQQQQQQQQDQNFCQEIWSFWPVGKYYYSMALMILQFVLPLFVLVITYTRIVIIVWGKRMPGEEDNARDARMARSKRKMIKMVIFCVIAFALTWLPFNALILIGDVYNEIWEHPNIMYIWFITHYLAMCHTITNPLIYIWMNNRFRAGFKQVIGDIYRGLYRFFAFICCFCLCFACCLNCSRKKYAQLIMNLNRKRGGSRPPLNSSGSVNIYANSNHHHHYQQHNSHNNTTNNSNNNNYLSHNNNNGNDHQQHQSHQLHSHRGSGIGSELTTTLTGQNLSHNSSAAPSSSRANQGCNPRSAVKSLAQQNQPPPIERKSYDSREDHSVARPSSSAQHLMFSSAVQMTDLKNASQQQQTGGGGGDNHQKQDGGSGQQKGKQNCDKNHENTPGAIDSSQGGGGKSVAIQMETTTTSSSLNNKMAKTNDSAYDSPMNSKQCCSSSLENNGVGGGPDGSLKPKKARLFFLSKPTTTTTSSSSCSATLTSDQQRQQAKKKRSKKQSHSISLQMTTFEFYRPPQPQTNEAGKRAVAVEAAETTATASATTTAAALNNLKGKKSKCKSGGGGGSNSGSGGGGLSLAARRAARGLRKLTSLSTSNCPTCRSNSNQEGDNNKDRFVAVAASSSLSLTSQSGINNELSAEDKRAANKVAPTKTKSFGNGEKDETVADTDAHAAAAAARSLKFVVDMRQSSLSTATNSALTNITSLAASPASSSRERAAAIHASRQAIGGGSGGCRLDGLEATNNNSSNNTSASSFSNAENGIITTDRVTDQMSPAVNQFEENSLRCGGGGSLVLPGAKLKSKLNGSSSGAHFATTRASACDLDVEASTALRKDNSASALFHPHHARQQQQQQQRPRQTSIKGRRMQGRQPRPPPSGSRRRSLEEFSSSSSTTGRRIMMMMLMNPHHSGPVTATTGLLMGQDIPVDESDELFQQQRRPHLEPRTGADSSSAGYNGDNTADRRHRSGSNNNSATDYVISATTSESEAARQLQIDGKCSDEDDSERQEVDSYCAEHRNRFQPISKTGATATEDERALETDEDVCDVFENTRLNLSCEQRGKCYANSMSNESIQMIDQMNANDDDDNHATGDTEDEEAEQLELEYGYDEGCERLHTARESGAIELIQFKKNAHHQQHDKKRLQTASSALFNGGRDDGQNSDLKRRLGRLFSMSTEDVLPRRSGDNGFHYYAIKQQRGTESRGSGSDEEEEDDDDARVADYSGGNAKSAANLCRQDDIDLKQTLIERRKRKSLSANESKVDIEMGGGSLGADQSIDGRQQQRQEKPSICTKEEQHAIFHDNHFLLNLGSRNSTKKLLSNSANNVISAEQARRTGRDEEEAEEEEYEIMVINNNDNNNKPTAQRMKIEAEREQQSHSGKSRLMPSSANDERLAANAPTTPEKVVDLTAFASQQIEQAKKHLKQQQQREEDEQTSRTNFNSASAKLKNCDSGKLNSGVDEKKMEGKVTSSSPFGKPFKYNQANGPVIASSGKQSELTSSKATTTTTTICNQSSSAPNSETKKVCLHPKQRQDYLGARQQQLQHHQQAAQLNGLRAGQLRLSGAYSMPAHFYQLQPSEASERKLEVEV